MDNEKKTEFGLSVLEALSDMNTSDIGIASEVGFALDIWPNEKINALALNIGEVISVKLGENDG